MFGLPTASQIASASAASVLFRFTYGLTYCGGISRTEWPRRDSSRAQWCAAEHASIPTKDPGSLAKYGTSSYRESRRRSTVLPASSTQWIWKTDFARSRPMVTMDMDAPLLADGVAP